MLILSKKDFWRLIKKISHIKNIMGSSFNEKIFIKDRTTALWRDDLAANKISLVRILNIDDVFMCRPHFEMGLEVFDNSEESYRIIIHKRKDYKK